MTVVNWIRASIKTNDKQFHIITIGRLKIEV